MAVFVQCAGAKVERMPHYRAATFFEASLLPLTLAQGFAVLSAGRHNMFVS